MAQQQAQQIIQLSMDQLKELIESVRGAATSGATAAAAAAESKSKSKGSISECPARFGGNRSYDAVEEFVTAVETYKTVESISDEDALKGLSLLFHDLASVWWQGVRKEAKTFNEAIALVREHFSPIKPAYQVYMEIFDQKQNDDTPIDTFICRKRALLAQLPDGRHDEEAEVDLVYGLVNIKYRKHIPRHDVKTFRDLLEKGRIIEQNSLEAGHDTEHGRKIKRCTYCNFRGHVYQECRKRKRPTEKRTEKQ